LITVVGRASRTRESYSRREWLRLGALGSLGLSLTQLVMARESAEQHRGSFSVERRAARVDGGAARDSNLLRAFVGRGSPDPAQVPDRRSASFGVCSDSADAFEAWAYDEHGRPSVRHSGGDPSGARRPAPNTLRDRKTARPSDPFPTLAKWGPGGVGADASDIVNDFPIVRQGAKRRGDGAKEPL